ncbi:glycosyltransferase family 8 protein [Hansschlegelia zhihuaiae]|uniref:glycosyltransferase family 8 protein n=1 Tax=Hansschlegelia zhihuaiae TaxID=405005 RepID=UPI0013E8C939|nr:glycosyltransferase [Hansschlegelia zhihuaiae]
MGRGSTTVADPLSSGDPLSTGDAFELERNRRLLAPAIKAKLDAGQVLQPLEQETLLRKTMPVFQRRAPRGEAPSGTVAFVMVADRSFLPGLAALLLSLMDVYPDIENDVVIFHDGSLSELDQAYVTGLYPHATFSAPDMDWLDLSEYETSSRRRIGKLGYMKFCALRLSQYERVVVLDADTLINGDVSALWEGDETNLRIAYDFGDREYASVSNHTGREVLNSGVISIPGVLLNEETFEAAKAVIGASLPPLDDVIDRFADQKAWNVFLMGKPVTILPPNYNCNIKYIGKFLGGQTEGISILHFAGPKPWNKPSKAKADPGKRSQQFPAFWTNRVRPLHFEHRLRQFQDETRWDRREPALPRSSGEAATCLLIETLRAVDHIDAAGSRFETVWLPDPSEAPAATRLAPHHAVLGWRNFVLEAEGSLRLDDRCAEAIHSLEARPVLWAPFAAKAPLEGDRSFQRHEINYLLHERPFVRYVDVVGSTEFDVAGYLDSARLDCLTYGAPIAKALGFRRAVIVNHGPPTDMSSLFNAFRGSVDLCPSPRPQATNDRVDYAVRLTASALAADGVELLDGTRDRKLPLTKWDEGGR